MAYRKVIEDYYKDVNNTASLLSSLINSYKVLVDGADELNKIALASKSDIKKALKRADKLGKTIDEILDVLDKGVGSYIDYCEKKSEIIKSRINNKDILMEIEETWKSKNS